MKYLRVVLLAVAVLTRWEQSGAQQGRAALDEHTRPVEVTDPFLHMTMLTMFVPSTWSGQGTVLRGVGCGTESPHMVFRASSPNGLTGYQVMPPVIWYDSPNPAVYSVYGSAGCAHLGDTDPTDIALRIASTRPNARIVSLQKGFKARNDAEQQRFKMQSAATLANTQRTIAQTQAQNEQLQRTGQDQIDYLAGNQYYLNPSTGQTYTINASDSKTYMHDNGTGTSSVYRTGDAYQQMQMPSDWVELQAIHH